MKHVKQTAAIIFAVIFAVSLTACSLFGHSYDPAQTGIYIADDRTVTSAEITDFDNSGFDTPRYDEAEYTAFAEDTVKAFNSEKAGISAAYSKDADGTLPVAIETIDISGTTGKTVLKFEKAEYLLGFFGTTDALPVQNLIVGSVADGISSGLSFENMVDAEGNTVSSSTVKEDTGYTLVLIEGNTEVQCEGKIVYRSADIAQTDDYTVQVSGSQAGLIVFK